MEIFDNYNKLILAILFFIPGFISMKTYEIATLSTSKDFSKSIIEVISFSSLVYAIAAPVIMILIAQETLPSDNPWILGPFWLILLFLFPAVLSIFWVHARKWKWIRRYLPHPIGKAWDYIFSKNEQLYIIATLKSGKKIAGAYSTNSFASSGAHREQIYLEELWELDYNDNFVGAYLNTRGILVDAVSIESIEFISPQTTQETSNGN